MGLNSRINLINEVCEQLGVKHKIYLHCHIDPQSNGRRESFHYFLKACISKHITRQIEWDDVVPLACVVHTTLYQMNIQKKVHSFLCLGRDAVLPLNKLLQPQV